jgi:Zn finger protein HypA/HybF involved in hydrogenase expression
MFCTIVNEPVQRSFEPTVDQPPTLNKEKKMAKEKVEPICTCCIWEDHPDQDAEIEANHGKHLCPGCPNRDKHFRDPEKGFLSIEIHCDVTMLPVPA